MFKELKFKNNINGFYLVDDNFEHYINADDNFICEFIKIYKYYNEDIARNIVAFLHYKRMDKPDKILKIWYDCSEHYQLYDNEVKEIFSKFNNLK